VVSFKAERAMFRSRSVTNLRIRTCMGKIIKVMIDLVELMGGATWSSAPWWTEGAEWLTLRFKRVQDGSKVTPTQFRIQRHKPLVENNKSKIKAPSWCWSTTTCGHPWIHQENFKIKISALTPNLTWLRAVVSKCKSETALREIWLGAKYKSYRRLFSSF
jgi:hypothetical protein